MVYLCLGSVWDFQAFKFNIDSVEGEEKDD